VAAAPPTPYPELWTSSGRAQREAAAAVCATCAVAPECLRWAVRDLPATDTSVWAGTGPRERTALRRHHRRAQAALDQVLAA
jgi:WhiB family transcriptional regulator, redox-sensing transcriptional regulator